MRDYETLPSYQVIFEWEDDLSEFLQVPVSKGLPALRRAIFNKYTRQLVQPLGPRAEELLNEFAEFASFSRKGNGHNLVFELHNYSYHNFSTASKAIPVMIDLWKTTDFNLFFKLYRNCRLVLISSLETFNFLKSINCPLNIAHFPLFLSDRYILSPNAVHQKKYDILLAGRSNPVLKEYTEAFVKKFPSTEFLSQQIKNGEHYYVSNKSGIIGKFQNRDAYMNLLRASKVSFYFTPGMDGRESLTGGFNPVTPRFLELLSAQCLLLGRYPDNEETKFYELSKVCPNVDSYESFEQVVLSYLSTTNPDFADHQRILEKHSSSVRKELLLEILAMN